MPNIVVRHLRNKNHLYIGVGFLIALALIVYFLSPKNLVNLFMFYLLLGLSSFFLLHFLVNHKNRALAISGGIILIFLLRHLGLTSIVYPILVIALILSLEAKWKNY
jgi:hypothetical protein